MDERLHICLLGEFSISKGDQPVRTLNAERPQTLLAYLLLHQQAPIPRQRLAYIFWPDSDEEQARTNLRNLLHRLRRSLPDADTYLHMDTHTVQWLPQGTTVLDVAAFQDALTAAKLAVRDGERQVYLETAVSFYKGLLLPGNYDEWLIPIREALQQTYQEALYQLAHLLADSADYQTALHYARILQKQDPLAETAVILTMKLHAHMGDQTSVRRVYQACVTLLRQELDAEPGKETQVAYAEAVDQTISDGEDDKTDSETAVPTPKRSSPRLAPLLPPHPTSFLGREEELAKLAERVADPYCRLITIVGSGGTGKTRLALQAAYGHVGVFANGAAFIPLTAISDPIILPSAIAQGLHISSTAASSWTTQILQYLADKEMLLVLDNLEQLIGKVGFLSNLLAAAPQVKLLATSRQRLNLQEEWVFPLQGFPLPDEQDLLGAAENSGAALFVQSARRHNTDFVPDDEAWQAIVHICHLVNGMPLGLELAASWIRLLTCAEIALEIEKNLDFLTSSQHNVPDRHRSVRAVFNQSWEMLTPPQQAVFGCLSLFAGGFSREAAAEVAGASLSALSDLLEKSLVRRLANGRYDIHLLLRQYAANRLTNTPETETAARSRFTAYYLSLAETAVPHLVGSDQQTWLDNLEAEYDNLRLVLAWSVQNQDAETAVRLGAALGRYWWLRHRAVEGGNWLRQILALPSVNTESRTRAMSYAGMLARLRRDYTEGEAWLTQSIHDQRQAGSKQDLGRSLNELGMLWMDQGQFDPAHQLFEEWLALARDLDFAHGITIALLNLGMVTQYLDQFNEAESYYREGLSLSREMGLKTNEAMILNSYSTLLLEQNRLEPAREMLLESVRLNVNLGHQDGIAWALLGLLRLTHLENRLEIAANLVGVHETIRQSLGAPLPPTNQLYLDRITEELRQLLGPELFASLRQSGRTMSVSIAIDLVQR